MDAAVACIYDKWKSAYVKEGCGGNYVLSVGGTGTDVGDEVSEGHGYGMIAAALMCGHDPDAAAISTSPSRCSRPTDNGGARA